MLDIANTVLAAAPYFDDYNESKNFYRVLFRPAVAVQARELTQIQDIMQTQVSRIGDNLFKDGSIVQGCSIEYITDLEYVGIEDQFSTNSSLAQDDPSVIDAIAIGQTSGAQAIIVSATPGFIRQTPGRYFVRYTAPGANTRSFIAGEAISLYSTTSSYVEDVIITVANSAPFANSIGTVMDEIQANNAANVIGRGILTSVNTAINTLTVNNIERRFDNTGIFIISGNPTVNSAILTVGYDVSDLIGTINTLSSNTDGIAISNSNIAGVAYGAYVSEGIVYHKGFFIEVQPGTVIVNPNSNDPSGCALGFITAENVITEYVDSSLYDNALGYNNFNAPGARRLNLVSTLVSRSANAVISNTDIFFAVVEFSNSGVAYDRTDPQYAALGDAIAKRTYEADGDFIVDSFTVSSDVDPANVDNVTYLVTPGLAYVQGYRNQLLTNLPIIGRKGTDTISFDEQIVTMSYGNYVQVNQLRGAFPVQNVASVELYDTRQTAISSGKFPTSAASGNVIGSASVISVIPTGGTKGSSNGAYNMYLFDIAMSNGNFSFANVASIVYTGGSANAFADIPANTTASIISPSASPLIFPVGTGAIKTLADSNAVSQSEYYYLASNTSASLDSTGHITFQVPSGGGILGFSDGSPSSIAEVTLILEANAYSSNLFTTSANVYANSVITGTGIGTLYNPGEGVGHGSNTYLVASVIDANTILVANTLVAATAQTIFRVQYAGAVVPLDGTTRTMAINSNTQATIYLGNTYTNAPIAASLTFYALQNQATQMKKIINRSTAVIIQTAGTGTDTGPWNLGIPDAMRIAGVYTVTGANSTQISCDQTTNLGGSFVLDNGQRDAFYDHASVTLSSGEDPTLFANTRYIVVLDHFTANSSAGKGYFSVDSYPVDDTLGANTIISIRTYQIPTYYASSSSETYDLRDCLDFRPYKLATATITTDVRAATVSPATTLAFDPVTTSYQPFPGQNFQLNYTQYLPRKDILTLTSDGTFEIIEGISSIHPIFPNISDNSLSIVQITVPPYPSLSDTESKLTSRTDYDIIISLQSHQRFTMQDIGKLQQRIQNLEYYTTLNTLQIAAANTNVLSQDGSARFKNGIFVDPFNDHSFGRVTDPQYAIAIDEDNGYARPFFQPEIFELNYDPARSTGITQVGETLMMSFGELPFLTQPFATPFANVGGQLSGSPPNYSGSMILTPSILNELDVLGQPINIISSGTASQALAGMILPTMTTLYGWWRNLFNTNLSASSATAASVQLYMRERQINFMASGLKPYTSYLVYIDDNAVGAWAAMMTLDSGGNPVRLAQWGSDLTASSRGILYGTIVLSRDTYAEGVHTVKLISTANEANGYLSFIDNQMVSAAAAQFNVIMSTTAPLPPIKVIPAPRPVVPSTLSPPLTVVPSPIAVANTIAPTAAPNVGPSAFYTQTGTIYQTAPTPHIITFVDGSGAGSGAIVSWEWDFGDGSTYSGQYPPAHTYSANGVAASVTSYNATLKVIDTNSKSSSYTSTFTLYQLAAPPIAAINIVATSGSVIVGTGVANGVYQSSMKLTASASTLYTGAYYNWTLSVISGNTLTSNAVSGTSNSSITPVLIDTTAFGSAGIDSRFTANVAYQYANGFIIGQTGGTFQLNTTPAVPVVLNNNGPYGSGGCADIESYTPDDMLIGDYIEGDPITICLHKDLSLVERSVESARISLQPCSRMTMECGYSVILSNDTLLEGHDEHRFLVTDALGEQVPVWDGSDSYPVWDVVASIEAVADHEVNHISINGDDHCYWAGEQNGKYISIHNKELPVFQGRHSNGRFDFGDTF